MKDQLTRGIAAIVGMVLFPVLAVVCSAADSKTPGSRAQIDATVIHVDKYGIYVPSIVFYFDSEMGKQKIDSLTAAAERLRNKKATITYSANGDLSADKHPLVLDIAPYRDEPKALASEAAPSGRVQSLPEGKPVSSEFAERSESSTLSVGSDTPQNVKERKPDRRAQSKEFPERNESGASSVGSDTPQSPKERNKPVPPISRLPSSIAGGEENSRQGVDRREPIRKDEVITFIDRCMKATVRKDTDAVLSCYADNVDYYAKGPVNRDFIRRDKGYYFRNWDRIDSSIEGAVVLIVTDQQDLKIAKFISAYNVQNARKSISGKAENIWTIQRINDDLKIVDEKQKILSSESRP